MPEELRATRGGIGIGIAIAVAIARAQASRPTGRDGRVEGACRLARRGITRSVMPTIPQSEPLGVDLEGLYFGIVVLTLRVRTRLHRASGRAAPHGGPPAAHPAGTAGSRPWRRRSPPRGRVTSDQSAVNSSEGASRHEGRHRNRHRDRSRRRDRPCASPPPARPGRPAPGAGGGGPRRVPVNSDQWTVNSSGGRILTPGC